MECGRPNCQRVHHRSGLCHKHYKHLLKDRPSGFVDIVPVREHVERLLAAGMTRQRIADLAGVSRMSTINPVLSPDRVKMRAYAASRIMAVKVPAFATPSARLCEWIPIVGTQRRLQALMAVGYTIKELAARTGYSWQSLSKIVNGHEARVRTDHAEKVEKLFIELQLIPGTNRRAILRAQRQGWPPPLAWDEDSIDDPDAAPHAPRSDKDAWFDDYQELRSIGLSHDQIAERWDVQANSLSQRLRRLNAGA